VDEVYCQKIQVFFKWPEAFKRRIMSG
jgi:hypothetical protein